MVGSDARPKTTYLEENVLFERQNKLIEATEVNREVSGESLGYAADLTSISCHLLLVTGAFRIE